MELEILKKRILTDGKCLEGGALKVDNFINHQMDPHLIKQAAEAFASCFADTGANKILTVEASGIAPAIILGYIMDIPVVFAKKNIPFTMTDAYHSTVLSFTKQRDFDIYISKEYLSADDRILFIDDFLACACTAEGIIDICQQAGATIAGMGFLIEKSFQKGREVLREKGITRIESLAIIESLDNGVITLKE